MCDLRWQPELLWDTDTWWCLWAARDEVTKQGKSPSRAAYLAFAERGLAWARTLRNHAEAERWTRAYTQFKRAIL